MKHIIFSFIIAVFCLPLSAQIAVSARDADKIVASIGQIQGAFVFERFLVFTAPGSFRYAGIAFEHENYRTIHSLERVTKTDDNGKIVSGQNHYIEDNYLLYATEVPLRTNEVRYRMVFDGLWTTDPMNAAAVFDRNSGLQVSVLKTPYIDDIQTETSHDNYVRFICEGEKGLRMTVCGTFNNWDPYMYEMIEIQPGRYQLEMPLPPGTYYYTFMNGSNRYPDKTNPQRVYTDDGRVASVLVVSNGNP